MKRYLMIFGILCFLMGISETVFAEEGTRAILPVERDSETFYVNVSVNHEDLVYVEDDLMEVTVTSSQSGYLYLLYQDAADNVVLLFPNKFEQNNRIEANTRVLVPSREMKFDLKTMAPFGKEKLQAIVTQKQLKDASVANFSNSSGPVKLLSAADLQSMERAVRGIGVVERVDDGSQKKAEYTLEITTYAKGQRPAASQKKRIFVGICVAKYAYLGVNPLPACDGDLKAMGKFFAKSSCVDQEVSLIYQNEDVTLKKMHELFTSYLPEESNPGDEIIIYWTGHGAKCADTNGDEKDGYDETLVLYDSKVLDPETQLRDDEFGRWLQELSGRKVFIIMDACYSGGLGNHAKSLRNSQTNGDWDFGFGECAVVKDLGQSDLALISSSAQSEVSLVRPDQGMSVMTWYILDELNKTPSLTHTRLYQNIKDKVYNFVKDEYNVEQNVFMQDALSNPMILNP